MSITSRALLKLQDGETEEPTENLALAFGLVTAAGLSTTVGAAMVFCDCFFHLDNHLILGAALGFSAGVMFYVSLIEIFNKSIVDFQACDCLWDDGNNGESAGYTMATISFFIGVFITYMLDLLVHFIFSKTGHAHSHGIAELHHQPSHPPPKNSARTQTNTTEPQTSDQAQLLKADLEGGDLAARENLEIPDMMDRETTNSQMGSPVKSTVRKPNPSGTHEVSKDFKTPVTEPLTSKQPEEEEESKERLRMMGLMTAVAIGLHNFPEGLATFVATLADPSVGVALAVAIAIHNIPEGLCVAVPVYYATGSRWKGFWMSFWSGITELVGAALGYLFLQNVLGPAAFAAAFGVVAGMMVTIVLKELVPTAHKYDPNDRFVTKSVFLGAFVMALSLVLFQL